MSALNNDRDTRFVDKVRVYRHPNTHAKMNRWSIGTVKHCISHVIRYVIQNKWRGPWICFLFNKTWYSKHWLEEGIINNFLFYKEHTLVDDFCYEGSFRFFFGKWTMLITLRRKNNIRQWIKQIFKYLNKLIVDTRWLNKCQMKARLIRKVCVSFFVLFKRQSVLHSLDCLWRL